jgi:hypothetical protein
VKMAIVAACVAAVMAAPARAESSQWKLVQKGYDGIVVKTRKGSAEIVDDGRAIKALFQITTNKDEVLTMIATLQVTDCAKGYGRLLLVSLADPTDSFPSDFALGGDALADGVGATLCKAAAALQGGEGEPHMERL